MSPPSKPAAASANGLTNGLLHALRELSPLLDAGGDWPARQFEHLAQAGTLGWVIPRRWGGSEVAPAELLDGYVRLAGACLATTFVLTQRNGACQRIAASDNASLQAELLPPLARGELFATVGISHLTTSRQHLRQPAVSVSAEGSGYLLDGEVPWVTGAGHADYLITGGTLADGRQILAALPASLPGIEVAPPVRLLALSASRTSAVQLRQVAVEPRWLLSGPVERVMQRGLGAGAGSLATSALAVGLSQSAIAGLHAEAERRPDLAEIVEPLRAEGAALRGLLLAAAESTGGAAPPDHAPEAIRSRANSLALRSTQALLTASKGAGFVAGHFAERAVREALFFLVWSCPQPVAAAALRELAGVSACG